MSVEIYWLVWTVILTAAMVLPYAGYRIGRIGVAQVFLNPLPGDDPFEAKWAHRAYRAQMNAFEGLALFAPLAIAVHVTGMGNDITAAACMSYFWLRLVYAPLYYFNVPIFRTVVWFASLGATLTLAYQLLNAVG